MYDRVVREAKNQRFGFQSSTATVTVGSETVDLYYIEKGNRDLPVVFLLHGLGGTASNWLFNSDLSESYRLIAVDQPGFGLSSNFRDESSANMEFVVKILEAFLSQIGVGDLKAIVGNSMGGAVAIHLAKSLGTRVSDLVLLAPGGVGREINRKSLVLNWTPEWFFHDKNWHRIEEWLSKRRDSNAHLFADPDLGARLAKDAVDKPSAYDQEWIKGLRAVVRYGLGRLGQKKELLGLVAADLKKITCNVLIVWGNRDQVLPPKHGHRLKELIPKSKLILFKNCGHLPHIEQHDKFNRTVGYFLEDLSSFNSKISQEEIFAHII